MKYLSKGGPHDWQKDMILEKVHIWIQECLIINIDFYVGKNEDIISVVALIKPSNLGLWAGMLSLGRGLQ